MREMIVIDVDQYKLSLWYSRQYSIRRVYQMRLLFSSGIPKALRLKLLYSNSFVDKNVKANVGLSSIDTKYAYGIQCNTRFVRVYKGVRSISNLRRDTTLLRNF